ncbi:MAG: hypothetical protein A2017_18355 [Lentisphaerae bacterium GWF2_44_16]|nr:MAG: hypothetical protein A2017_18355 [Lentisphaerae bacterium GWF2_44_16]
MNIRTELFLAWRYLRPKRNAVSVITCISIAGVTLGVAVLIVVLAVMTGFTDMMKEKLLETTAHIQIYDYMGFIKDPASVISVVEKNGASAMPVVYKPVLIQKDERFVPKGVLGIDPLKVNKKFNIDENLKAGKFSLEKNEAIVSDIIAQELNLIVGDKILLHAPNKLAKMVKVKEKGKIEIDEKADMYLPGEFKVSGIYSFGKYDFDKNIIFTNIDDANELFGMPWGSASTVYVWTKDPFDMNDTLKALHDALPGKAIMSWQQINRKLLGVLAVEKNMMFFLLIFIVLVAAFSITNTLITVVVQKTREIGLLKALGSSSGSVMRVFILQGFFVGLLGTVFGNALGISVIYWRNNIMHSISRTTGMELFPKEFYFFNELPAHIVTHDLLFIGIISVILCTTGGIIPAWRAARLDPASALRYE